MFHSGGELHSVEGMDLEQFKGLWINRERRDLVTNPITSAEILFIKEGNENHLHSPGSPLAPSPYNFLGPGTEFWMRKDGHQSYVTAMAMAGKAEVGTEPYDEPVDALDWCALMHDIVYSNPLCRLEMIARSDERMRACVRTGGPYNKSQWVLNKVADGGFWMKPHVSGGSKVNPFQDGWLSSSAGDVGFETDDMNEIREWIQTLRREQVEIVGIGTTMVLHPQSPQLTEVSMGIMNQVIEMARRKGLQREVDIFRDIEVARNRLTGAEQDLAALNRIIRFLMYHEKYLGVSGLAAGQLAGHEDGGFSLETEANPEPDPETRRGRAMGMLRTLDTALRDRGAEREEEAGAGGAQGGGFLHGDFLDKRNTLMRKRKKKRKHKRKHTKRKYTKRKSTKRKRKRKYTKRK